jgi:hypothetical protein
MIWTRWLPMVGSLDRGQETTPDQPSAGATRDSHSIVRSADTVSHAFGLKPAAAAAVVCQRTAGCLAGVEVQIALQITISLEAQDLVRGRSMR